MRGWPLYKGARNRHACMHACVRTRPFKGGLSKGYDDAVVSHRRWSLPAGFVVVQAIVRVCRHSLRAHKGTRARGGESYALRELAALSGERGGVDLAV